MRKLPLALWGLAFLLLLHGPASADDTITADLFSPDFHVGDSNYHCLLPASDGRLYFVINSHNPAASSTMFRFHLADQTIERIGSMNELLKEPVEQFIPQGKVHAPLYEHDGWIYGASHTAYYSPQSLPNPDGKGQRPYPGGHFFRYRLNDGTFEDLGRVFTDEGIITMQIDRQRGLLVGLTWPSGLLVTCDIATRDVRTYGAVQGRGEWEPSPTMRETICRTLGADPEGHIYGSTSRGLIWRFTAGEPRPVEYFDGIDLTAVPMARDGDANQKQGETYLWRTVDWNPATKSFWGVDYPSTTLFEFSPEAKTVRSVCTIRAAEDIGPARNPRLAQLGLTVGPENTILYLAHAPEYPIEDRRKVGQSVHLITYDPTKSAYVDHGAILSRDKRRLYFTESIAVASDDHIYTVAWVEVIDEARQAAIQVARNHAAPAETKDAIYEIQLVRLPKWQTYFSR